MTGNKINVLLIDDDDEDFLLTRELLNDVKTGMYALDRASSYEEGLAVAARGEHDVCLVDYQLGAYNGVQLIREAREARLTTPMILLTGSGDRDVDVAAMEAGATDYLVKHETSPARLERTIRYAVQLSFERREVEQELRSNAQMHAVVAEVGRLALTGVELKALFDETVALVASTLGVEYCKVLELVPEGDALILRAGVGWKKEYLAGHVTVTADLRSGAGGALLSDEPVVVEDLSTETRFASLPLLHEHGVTSGLSVVIRGQTHTFGVLGAHTAAVRKFTAHDVDFLSSVANVLAAAVGRKQVEARIGRSEAQFRALFENALDPVFIADDTGAYLDVNPAAGDLLGLPAGEIVGHFPHDFAADEFAAKSPHMWQEFIRTGSMKGDYRLRRADGKIIDVEFSAKANFLPGRHLSILRDVTERRLLEAQLRQSQKMEAIGRLAGGVAHDFNNLLTAIGGYSELTLRQMKEDDPLRHYIEEIKKAGERSADLTNHLLAFSRQQILQPKVLALNEVINDTSKLLGRLIGEDIRLVRSLDPDTGHVKVDPGQLSQIIVNLAVNARDAMPHGGTLTLGTGNVQLDENYARRHVSVIPGDYVALVISDTGTGMDAETQQHIFEPFFTMKEIGKGTGLGLATVYGIVKQSGGDISVRSEPGSGTTFKIYLPRVNHQTRQITGLDAAMESPRGTETILLAEDEIVVRKLTLEILQGAGYTVLDAPSGPAALLAYTRHPHPIDLVISDVVMPEMSGRDLVQRLVLGQPELRVIYMSGYTTEAVVFHGVPSEGTNFIQKPYSPDGLLRKVREVLDRPA